MSFLVLIAYTRTFANILIKKLLDKGYDYEVIDLQINGFKTKDFACNFWQSPDNESINSLNQYLSKEAVEGYLATLITSSLDEFEKNLQRIQNYVNKHGKENLIGVHIEGGLISRLGVHPQEHAETIHYKEAKSLIAKFGSLIKLWTLCPKLDADGQITRLAQDHDIVVSYGHSNASYSEASSAFEKYGVNLVTHWGNAMYVMDDFKQRDCSDDDLTRLDSETEGGLGLAAYQNPDIYCMVIAGSKEDNDEHLDPQLLAKLFRKKKNKMILVSDAVVPGPGEGLQGGLAPLSKHAQNALKIGVPEHDVINSCTKTPKEVLHMD